MKCNVVAVGTELLLGQIVDTNSSYIGEQLAAVGIGSHLQLKVGDNLARVVAAIRLALEDADAVIICGGLGPTHDDLPREALAEIMGVPLEHNDHIAQLITNLFAKMAIPMRGFNSEANVLKTHPMKCLVSKLTLAVTKKAILFQVAFTMNPAEKSS